MVRYNLRFIPFPLIDSDLIFLLSRRNYFAQWAVVLPLEITAAGITVQVSLFRVICDKKNKKLTPHIFLL